MQSEREKKLILDSRNGDREAFELLFDHHKKSLKKRLVALTGNEFDANDLLQETLIKAYLKIDCYREDVSFSMWLNRIARNTFIDSVRRNAVKNNVFSASDLSQNDSVQEDTDEASDEKLGEVTDSLAELPEHYRRALELKYFGQKNYEEIAREMNVPVGTIKTWLHRAKNQIRKKQNG